jgi:hypothetical protein
MMKTFPLPFQLFDQAIGFYETSCKNNNLPYTAAAPELTRTEKTTVILSDNCSELARLQYDRNYLYFAANGTTFKQKIEYT